MNAHAWLRYVLHDIRSYCINVRRDSLALHLLRTIDALHRVESRPVESALSYDWLDVSPIMSPIKLKRTLVDIREYMRLNMLTDAVSELDAAIALIEAEESMSPHLNDLASE